MNESIEQDAENVVLRKHLAEERIDNQSIRYKVYAAMQEYGNQRFNAALSEAIEKIKKETIEPYQDVKAWTGNEIIEILEGLKK